MTDPTQLASRSFRLIETGDAELAREIAQEIIAPEFVNHEAEDDPEDVERNLRGPAGYLATGAWLHAAFSELRLVEQEVAATGSTVMAATLMTGRHTGTFQRIPATNRRFAQKQVHIFTVDNGRITSHRAVRDDLGLLLQLGWRPSTA